MGKQDQGVSHDRYMVIPRTLIFLTRGAQILLLKGAVHKKLWANRYNGVGGHIERGEDVLAAAQRELSEETGLDNQNLQLAGVVTVDTGENPGILFFVFRGECNHEELVSSGEGTLEWVDRDRLADLPLVEDLPVLLDRIFYPQSFPAPFFAQYRYDEQDRLQVQFATP